MEAWLDFGRGPLFRLAFTLMVLGLLRIGYLTVAGLVEAYRRSPDRILPWKDLTLRTLGWLFPFARLWSKRPVYSVVSFLFHAGLIPVPLFLGAHVLLWERSLGFAWPALPRQACDWLTLLVVAAGLGLLVGRLADTGARKISRKQELLWPPLLILPFASGYLCANARLEPLVYQSLMLVHVYSGNLIMLLIPFTKIAHCVLLPFSQLCTGMAWKFSQGAGDRVAATLGYSDRPTWAERPRVATHRTAAPAEEA